MHRIARSVSLASAATLFSLLAACAAPSGEEPTGDSDNQLQSRGRQLTGNEVAALIRQAGFPEASLSKLVCTAYYESRFYERASNRNTNGSTDQGLFQVNSVHLGEKNCPSTIEGMYDSKANARCALQIFNADRARGGGHDGITTPWAAYRGHKSECDRPASSGSPWAFDGSGSAAGAPPTPGQKPCASPIPDLVPTADQIACGGDADVCGFNQGHACASPADCCSNACIQNASGRMVCGSSTSNGAGSASSAGTGAPGGTCNREGAFYCGNPESNLKGDPNTLYHCENHRMVVSEACASGCSISARGVDDKCNASSGGTDFGNLDNFDPLPSTSFGGACVAADAACSGFDDVCCADDLGVQRSCLPDPNDASGTRFVCSIF